MTTSNGGNKIKISAMPSKTPSPSRGATSIVNSFLENDNFTLASRSANVSVSDTSRFLATASQTGSGYQKHVFNLCIAYSELDVLAKSMGVSHEVGRHAKSLYEQVYNFSDFEEQVQRENLIAACMYVACSEKNQAREISEAFNPTQVSQHICSVCEELKDFFAVPPQTRQQLIAADKDFQSVYADIARSSNKTKIPPHASNHAKQLYRNLHTSNTFKNQNQDLLIAFCLCIACHQLTIPLAPQEILALNPRTTAADMVQTLNSLEEFFAENQQQPPQSHPHSAPAGNIVHTLQALTAQLALNNCPATPAPALETSPNGEEAELEPSTAPATGALPPHNHQPARC